MSDRYWSRKRRHGLSNEPVYYAWLSIKKRCYSPTDGSYKNYGGRGITVCESWRQSFDSFLADMGHRPEGTILGRKDINGNYDPLNCVWTPIAPQVRKRRVSRMLDFRGELISLANLALREGVPYRRLASRIKRGWSVERAVTQGLMLNGYG